MIDPIPLYTRILDVTKSEKAALDNNDFDNLLKLINEREKLLEETKNVNFNALNDPHKASIKQLLEEIKSIDENNIMRIEMIKNGIITEISDTVEQKKVQKYIASYKNISNGIKG